MRNLLKKQITALIISGILLILIILIVLFFLHSMGQKVEKVTTVKQQIASYQDNKKVISEETDRINKLKDHINMLESYSITPTTTPELLSELENLANLNNIDFAITSVQTTNAKLVIDFSAKGGLDAIDKFLYVLKHQYYQVQILSITMQKETSVKTPTLNSQQWGVSVSMQIMSY